MMSNLRITEVFCKKTQDWIEIPFEHLKKGDKFRMFESTGEPVLDKDKNNIFYANSYPYLTEDGVYGILIKQGSSK